MHVVEDGPWSVNNSVFSITPCAPGVLVDSAQLRPFPACNLCHLIGHTSTYCPKPLKGIVSGQTILFDRINRRFGNRFVINFNLSLSELKWQE